MELTPGFIVLHSNRQEWLCRSLVEWMRRWPLAPLEDEVVLVQSNGIAQWLKIEMAAHAPARDNDAGGLGICACLEAQMPARFLWRAYRAVLGPDAIPATSPLAKSPLQWRLMRLLPQVMNLPDFEPLRRFLCEDDDLRRRYQLAGKLADLYDQYQVYRADWLAAWARGDDVLLDAGGVASPLDGHQRWQGALWRALLEDLPAELGGASRSAVHRRFREALARLDAPPPGLPRRVMVFGVSTLPQAVLEALADLGRLCQVVLCVHNPCRYYWADIIEGRELLRARRHRQVAKPGRAGGGDAESLHLRSNPLLAAWGRQGRDYIGLLDSFDEPDTYRQWVLRSELFEPWAAPPGAERPTLLAALQNGVLDLEPLPEPQGREALAEDDLSVAFHVAHGPMREVEILHDQLLDAFERAAAAGRPLRPRDVLVMVPDIDRFSPLIDAVFGRFSGDDPRFIPYTVADRRVRGRSPLLQALDYLLDLPRRRFLLPEVMDLLDVPAVRARFGLEDADLPELRAWMRGAGARWGLDAEHRRELGMPPGFRQNAWDVALDRMLLGYAVGSGTPWQDIEPYDEVGGLSAQRVGALATLLQALHRYRATLAPGRSPAAWGVLLRQLLDDFFDPREEVDQRLLHRLADALDDWLATCQDAGLEMELPLAVVAEAWLESLEQDSLSQRFLGGSVNFCTLMPMRAIPFRMVCLLGMNDGDYPRILPPADFDLMRQPGQFRPGDRSRREDDRYLFLEALLSARDRLYLSWAGRSIADNSEQPPSVLVGQLRDHIAAGWVCADGRSVLEHLTTEHPLQPFSPAYFRDGGPSTYAAEWRAMYGIPRTLQGEATEAAGGEALVLRTLARFLRQPLAFFLSERMGVNLQLADAEADDTEPFAIDSLEGFFVEDHLVRSALHAPEDLQAGIAEGFRHLRMAGRLPAGAFAEVDTADGRARAGDIAGRALELRARFPSPVPPLEVRLEFPGLPILEDWIDGLCQDGGGAIARIRTLSGKDVRRKKGKTHRLLPIWVDHVASVAAGCELTTFVVADPATMRWTPHAIGGDETADPRTRARALIRRWMELYLQGLENPLPVAAQTAMAWLEAAEGAREAAARKAFEGAGFNAPPGECERDPAVARFFPEFDALYGDGEQFAALARALYGELVDAPADGAGDEA